MSAGASAQQQRVALGHSGALPLADPQRQARRFLKRYATVQTVANVTGAIDVFILLFFVLPAPELPPAAEQDARTLSLLAFAVGLPVLAVLANSWGWRLARPVRRALITQGPLDDAARRAVLRHPLAITAMNAAIWALGAGTCFVSHAFVSGVETAAHIASVVVMGGLTTVALSYLLAERMMRPVVARALEAGAPPQPVGPGVRGRLLLAWVLATGVPLFGLASVAGHQLVEGDVSADRMAWSMLALSALAATTGLIATVLVAKSVAEPLTAVRRALGRIASGELDTHVRVDDVSEVGMLQSGFNEMAAGLRDRERLRDLFGRHVGEDVAHAAIADGARLGGEVRDVAVLFIDLIGSTGMAATRPPEAVVRTLNRFFGVVVDCVGQHGGFVNKFEGDGALCVFGAPVDLDDAPAAALATARSLRRRLAREVPELDAAIGLSCGPAVAGNVGAELRFEYTVIGDPVNEAARLCDEAKRVPERVVACGPMLERAGEAEARFWRTGESLTLRGRLEPTQLALPA